MVLIQTISQNGATIGLTIPEPGGGTMYINEENITDKPTEIGPKGDLEASTVHELIGHGIDAKRGETDNNPLEGFYLSQAEYNATERENIVRAEMEKPLRTEYTGHPVIRKTRNDVLAIPSGNLIRTSRPYKKTRYEC